ncbi:hypothetical protein NQ318_013820, partial [Aromia moschata]
ATNSSLANLFGRNNFLIRNIHACESLAANIQFNLSDIGEGIREVVVKEWYVKVGDRVQQFDNICEVQSDKASVTITSRYDGTVKKLYYAVDDTALVGKPLMDVETDEGDVTSSSSSDDEISLDVVPDAHEKTGSIQHERGVQNHENQPVLCIPSVRRLAKDHNVNLSSVKGTGKGGRILKEDVLKYLEKKADPVTSASAKDRTEPIKGFQKAMVRTMTEALNVPLFTYSDEIKVAKISELRRSLRTQPELDALKISVLSFFIKAISNALQRFPVLNASADYKCENITYHGHHNIGVAMDTKLGLAVPVIKKVEGLGVIEIARELNRLKDSGREGFFTPDDLSGGTFSISNIGAISGTVMKPIPLPPQAAIIALGASQILPRFDEDGNVVPEEILNVSVSADHRIIDGATVARFVELLKRQIENPYLLFLNV